MFTLIKREIRDNSVSFVLAIVISAVLIGGAISIANDPGSRGNLPTLMFSFFLVTFTIVGFCAMGSTQMYNDKTHKISALLATLSVARTEILIARIIAGIGAILTFLTPLFITVMILLHLTGTLAAVYGLALQVFFALFLLSFACYCLGLQTGWTSSKIVPTLGGLGLSLILISVILVKGFGPQTIAILLLFIIASLINTWHKFMSTSL